LPSDPPEKHISFRVQSNTNDTGRTLPRSHGQGNHYSLIASLDKSDKLARLTFKTFKILKLPLSQELEKQNHSPTASIGGSPRKTPGINEYITVFPRLNTSPDLQ
jgi:hypothetical protein